MNCLNKVIKLSRTECECNGEIPEGYNEGKVNIYLDELDGLNLRIVSGAEDNCDENGIWELMNRSRENAEQFLKADLMAAIETNYSPKRPVYRGLLGTTSFSQTLTFSDAEAGQILKFHRIVGGKIKINRIGLIVNTASTITVKVFNNDLNPIGNPLGEYEITANADSPSYGTLTETLELPMWSDTKNDLEYYVGYTVSGFLPKNNKPECVPCSGGVKNSMWSNWVSIKGYRGTGATPEEYTRTSEQMGIILDVDMSCDATGIICSDKYPLDFTTGRANQIAYAIRFKAGALLIDSILSSPEINR
mgnify:FL=1